MYKSTISQFVSGEPIKCIARVKHNQGIGKEDIKITGQNVALVDGNNRLIEEFDVGDVYPPDYSIQQIYETVLLPYLDAFTRGFTVSLFAFGCSGCGKTQTVEGNKREPGLVLLFGDSLFSVLENKKYQSNNQKGAGGTFSYSLRARYIEILDEEISDLLIQPGVPPTANTYVIFNEWEGPTLVGAEWQNISNASQLNELLIRGQKNRNTGSNEFGRLSDKSTTIFTIELLQTQELSDDRDSVVLVSRLHFVDLPGAEVLLEDPETLRVREGSTMNKSMLAFSNLIRDLAGNKGEYVYYESSNLTQLSRDMLGGNSLSVGIFNIAHGDVKKTAITLNYLKYARRIINFPVVNDGKVVGLLKQYRAEIIQLLNMKQSGGENTDGYNLKIAELEKKVIEDNLDRMRSVEEKNKVSSKFGELRQKYNELVKGKADLQGELIRSEEEKLELSKALVELQIENTRLMEALQNEKYDANNRVLNAENDILNANMGEETAMKQIQDLQDRIRELVEDKRELEIEFVALKKNFINTRNDYDNEKLKNENLGVEVINLVNENKALQNQINDTMRREASTSDQGQLWLKRIEGLERENTRTKEALLEAKGEVERMKAEFLKYELQDERRKLDIDNRKLDVEREFMHLGQNKRDDVHKFNQESSAINKKRDEEKLIWESQKIELSHKNKLLSRKNADLEDRVTELMRSNEDISTENSKMTVQIDEMRSVYRQQLMKFMTGQASKDHGGQQAKIGYDLNAREELVRTYVEKEHTLTERLEKDRAMVKHLKMENRALKQYSKSLKYLAEDWAPVGVQLPDILSRPAPVRLEDEGAPMAQRAMDDEMEKLRSRNRRLEEEMRLVQDQNHNQTMQFGKYTKDDNQVFQAKLINEIEHLKSGDIRRQTNGDGNMEQLRKERNDLQEENRRLVSLLKDNKKWDLYVLQRENERLTRTMKEFETNEAVGPVSGDSRGMKQKISFFEKAVKQLEKERSELLVRATMAEEQMKNLQEHMTKQTQDYQRKIIELKRQQKH